MLAALGRADWKDLFDDNPDVANMGYRNKTLARGFLPGLEMGVGEHGVRALPGVVDGEKIKLFFNQLVRANLGELDIGRLPLPLSIVATDIGSGEKVVFRDGSLTRAMRASMSVPGLMAPVEVDGHKLVDGGLVDNLPVAEARARCHADVVIAVDVGSPLLKAEQVGSALTVAAQMIGILAHQNVAQSRQLLGPADIYLHPDLDGIGAGDFERYADAAARGRAAAEALADRIAALGVDAATYAAWRRAMLPERPASPRVDAVEVVGLKRVDADFVRRHLEVGTGAAVDTPELERDLLRIYGDGYFESVDYTLLLGRERNILRVMPNEKSWGPDYLRFGLSLESAVGNTSNYNLRAAYQRTWLNPLGGEWLSTLQVGTTPGIGTEFYQPLDRRQRFFVDPALHYEEETYNLYSHNQRITQYNIRRGNLDLMAGANVGLLGPVKLGWEERYRSADVEIGLPAFEIGAQTYGGWLASLDFDQMDRLYQPTRGWSLRASWFDSPQQGYTRAEADLRGAVPLGDTVLLGRASAAGATRGTLPVYDAAMLGGFLNLSGFAHGQLLGNSAVYGDLRAERIIGRMPLGLRGDLRLGVALEAGRVDGRFTETQLAGWQSSTAIYLGGETPLGMMYLGFGHAPHGMNNVFVFVGTP